MITGISNRIGEIVLMSNKINDMNTIMKQYRKFMIVNLGWPSGNYSDLHSCKLKTKDGYIMENIWQSCKVYDNTVACKYKKFDTLIWQQDAEKHLDNDNVTAAYFAWKDRLIKNKYPVQYPCGYFNRNKYKFLLYNNKIYDANTGFKEIYTPMYFDLIKDNQRFKELLYHYRSGKNLLIICDELPYNAQMYNHISISKQDYHCSGYVLTLALLKELN